MAFLNHKDGYKEIKFILIEKFPSVDIIINFQINNKMLLKSF